MRQGNFGMDPSTMTTIDNRILIYSRACAIPDGESVVLTGGEKGIIRSKVSRYNKDGWMEDLADLNMGRWGHGCAGYKRGSGQVPL